MEIRKKTKNGETNGMGGVMNEGNLEARVMRQQAGVENVVALAPNGIVEKQLQAKEDIAKESTIDADRFEMDLEITILMI
jgi:hypothetical protein